MRLWSWSKGAIRVNNGDGFEAVFDFEDYWKDYGDEATEEIAEFIVDACNAAEQGAYHTNFDNIRALADPDLGRKTEQAIIENEEGLKLARTYYQPGRKSAQATLDALHRIPGAQVLP